MAKGGLLALLACTLACGSPDPKPKPQPKTTAEAAGDAAATAIEPLQFGMPDLARFSYRKRAGHVSFKLAQAAEEQGDWTAVAQACEAALAADADHLDASYLLAVAYAKLKQPEKLVAPLAKAVAGDFSKWGQASLDQPALQAFLSTPTGDAWRARIQTDRDAYIAALARSILVTSDGDVYAYDPMQPRWYRITRTAGAVVSMLHARAAGQLAYVRREREKVGNKHTTKIGIGLVDLTKGIARRPTDVPPPLHKQFRLLFSDKPPSSFSAWAGTGWRLVDDGKLSLVPLLPAVKPDKVAVWLEVHGRKAKIGRAKIDNVTADWDKRMLASAIKLTSSNRVVTVPAPGLIDGNTAQWSPDHTQLAFVAQLSDECTPGTPRAAAFVADAATGKATELERGNDGIAIEWIADRKLAIAGDKGVSIVDLGGGAPLVLEGADGLATPKLKPTCVAEPEPEDVIVDDPDKETKE